MPEPVSYYLFLLAHRIQANSFLICILMVAGVFWIHRLVKFIYNICCYWEIHSFYINALKIPMVSNWAKGHVRGCSGTQEALVGWLEAAHSFSSKPASPGDLFLLLPNCTDLLSASSPTANLYHVNPSAQLASLLLAHTSAICYSICLFFSDGLFCDAFQQRKHKQGYSRTSLC